jgi:hypothetical protein
MKPVDHIIKLKALHPDWCFYCIDDPDDLGKIFHCHCPKLSLARVAGEEPCLKADWDGCPFNK